MAGQKGMKRGIKGININQDQYEKLCALFCSIDEILAWFHVSYDCLDRWVKATYGKEYTIKQSMNEHASIGKISLRRTQMKHAEKFPAMAIFLGKQYLGQKDNNDELEERRQMVDNATNILVAIKETADSQEDTEDNNEPEKA